MKFLSFFIETQFLEIILIFLGIPSFKPSNPLISLKITKLPSFKLNGFSSLFSI